MLRKATLALAVNAALFAPLSFAQEQSAAPNEKGLEIIEVTAQKRTQSIQEVPISISTLQGEKFESLFSGGGDILELATRVPGLYAETSNGRVAPRFYIRGLGNTDFDLAASQPVAIVMDNVVKENVILKSFPLFDVQQVEVLRGPQGSLFGRNTTAGIVKFESNKPTQDFEAFTEVAVGNLGTFNVEAAVGGGLTDELSARFSVLSQNRDNWIDNGFTGEEDALGEFEELAWRGQLLWEPSNMDMTALLSVHSRELEGTSSIFRANALSRGSNEFNENYDRDVVFYDNGDGNPQDYDNSGASLTLEFDLDNGLDFMSITAYEEADGRSKGDIDGGVFLFGDPADINGDGTVEQTFPGFIPFDAVTEDQLDGLEQFTQEFRLSNDGADGLTWQLGAFYFDSEFDVTTIDGFFGATTVTHENTSWSLYGQVSYELNDKTTITGGLNWTDDEKTLRVGQQNVDGFAVVIGAATVQDYDDVEVDDSQLSGDLSINYKIDRSTSVYGRVAYGFRAPTIQGRDVAFESAPSVADAETVTSFEIGFKSDMLDNTLRLNGAIYYYQIDDMQFSAIGGGGNLTRLVNADKGIGQGFELEATWLATEFLTLTAGYSFNDTEIDDSELSVFPCGANRADGFGPRCDVTNPTNDGFEYFVDGNPFPQAPEQTFVFTARYAVPFGDSGEFFAFTDWAWQGETNLFLYEATEYRTDNQFEGGLRIGYEDFDGEYTIALFGRNITDEENLRGAIDFNNFTAIDNQPRIWGLEFRKNFY
jgi:iron complex outermembrane receptor protein